MGKHLSKYQIIEDYNNNKNNHVPPHVSLIVNPITQILFIPEPKPYEEQYFTIEALEDGLTVQLSQNACEYCIDDEWVSLDADTATPSINSGQKISFKITNPTITLFYGMGTFTISKKCNIEGNIMSLLYGDNFEGQIDLSGKDTTFCYLLKNCTTLQNAENLILPATTLASNCYLAMFFGCTGLTTAPTLPATILASNCYSSMFKGCTGLTSAPELPATTLASRCYSSMFEGCTGLTTAPELPATTLAAECYKYMFYGTNVLPDCSNIDFTNETVVASNGLIGLFAGTKVTDNDLMNILPKNNKGKYCLPVTTLAEYCYDSMFKSCTGLTTAPELPATALTNNCYSNMFEKCTGLTTTPTLPATILASNCYLAMFYGCTGLTTAPTLPATKLVIYCYQSMFSGCTGLVTAPELPATTLANACYSNMFKGCTGLTSAPELPATTLASRCYYSMFQGCSKLNYIKMLATDISASNCLNNWVQGVASSGTFLRHINMSSLPSGNSGIPNGWIVIDYTQPA